VLARDAKLRCLVDANQCGAGNEIDLARVMGRSVVFARVGKIYQGSEPLGAIARVIRS
jgi:hypothetical protein